MENPLVMTWPYYYLILTESFEISVPNSYLYVDFQLKMLRLKNKNKMLLLWKWGSKCHKYIGKPLADHKHHFVLWWIFELDDLGLSLNLKRLQNFFAKNWRTQIWGKNIYHITMSFSDFLKMLWNFGPSRYLYVESIPT